MEALPPTSAYRPAFLARLALGLLMRFEHAGGDEEDLDAAIEYSRVAIRTGATTTDAAVYACHLADALEHRWELHRDPADLHEAVRVYAAVMRSQPDDGARGVDLACNFAHTLLARRTSVRTRGSAAHLPTGPDSDAGAKVPPGPRAASNAVRRAGLLCN